MVRSHAGPRIARAEMVESTEYPRRKIITPSGVPGIYNVYEFDSKTGQYILTGQLREEQLPRQLLVEMKRFHNAMDRYLE